MAATNRSWRRLVDRKIVEFLLLEKSINQIVMELCIGKKRVRSVRFQALDAGYLGDPTIALPPYPTALFPDPTDRRSIRPSDPNDKLLGIMDWLKELLELGWQPITVFEKLPFKDVARSSFYRFLGRHRILKSGTGYRVVPEIVHRPGEALLWTGANCGRSQIQRQARGESSGPLWRCWATADS